MKSEEHLDATPDSKSMPGYESKEKGGADLHLTESNGVGVVVEETTHRGLKARHAQMIALGGTIGTHDTLNLVGMQSLTIRRYWSLCWKWCHSCQRRTSFYPTRLLNHGFLCIGCCHSHC